MEGTWRVVLVACALAASALTASGCGDDSEPTALGAGAVRSADPVHDFAPLVKLAADEPWRPTSVRWFLDRSVLWFAEDGACPDRKIAVGRTLAEQQSAEIDWIYPVGLGNHSRAYYRNPYDDSCRPNLDMRAYADQFTSPGAPGPRPEGLARNEGYYLDFSEGKHHGPDTLGRTPVYAERRDEDDGEVRLIYWMLFALSDALPGADRTTGHEGDWERVDVLLGHDGGSRYEPQTIELRGDRPRRSIPWSRIDLERGHPVLTAERGNHSMAPAPPGQRCADCVPWPTWKTLQPAREQPWYGFGGAWGEPEFDLERGGLGPVGPHGAWSEYPEQGSAQRAR